MSSLEDSGTANHKKESEIKALKSMREDIVLSAHGAMSSNVSKYLSNLGMLGKAIDKPDKNQKHREKHKKLC
jgi:hypothetical protein